MSSGLETRPGATTHGLDDLVGMAWAGRIRIPHFQREFRWGREDVVRLLDSIVRRYPVGSLLLWQRPAPAGAVTLGKLTIPGPAVDNALWVVDGQQRITSLANVLHPDGQLDPRFALGFDLLRERIVPLPAVETPAVIPLPVVFDLSKVLAWFAARPEVADLSTRAFDLTKQLREFTIPAYTVVQDDVAVLQDIFDRMNNFGKRLSRAEVFSALTAGTEAAAPELLTLARIAEGIDARLNFGCIDNDTVLRAVLARRGPDIQREIRLEFDPGSKASAEFPGEDRDTAFGAGEAALTCAVGFLQASGVPHLALLPYRYLLITLARVFAHHPEPDAAQRRLLARWFWQAAVHGPESFKGVTGAARSLCGRVRPGDLSGSIQQLFDAMPTQPAPPINVNRFRTNEAVGKIVLCAYWALEPRSPDTGAVYAPDALAEVLAGRSTAADAVRDVIARSAVPERYRDLPANRLLMPTLHEAMQTVGGMLESRPMGIEEPTWADVLRSHAMNEEIVSALTLGDVERVLTLRQDAVAHVVLSFIERKGEWTFENTPSLADMELADLEAGLGDDAD